MEITNESIDLWGLTTPMSDFNDDYEIWQATLYTPYKGLGEDFTGSIVGYVEPIENKEYSVEYASGQYKLNVYTHKGELIQDYDILGDKLVRWAGFRRLPFVGYVNKDNRSSYSTPEATIWIIIPKTKEQFLSAIATFYKRRKKKAEAPNIVGLSEYMEKATSIGEITDITNFTPLRHRLMRQTKRLTATQKRIAEYRSSAPEVTDNILVDSLVAKYNDFFIDNEAVVTEGIKETYRNGLPLTKENVLQQIEYLVEDRKLLQYYTQLQHIYSPEANILRDKANQVIETLYETACKRVCNVSEFADEEVMEYFKSKYSHRDDLTLAKIINNFCCSYHCRKYNLISCIEANDFPPFKCFDYRFGKDVTLAPTFEEAKAYNDKQTAEEKSKGVEKETTEVGKKGCLLWFILIPSSILGLLFSVL
jgi:hypothetical protein